MKDRQMSDLVTIGCPSCSYHRSTPKDSLGMGEEALSRWSWEQLMILENEHLYHPEQK